MDLGARIAGQVNARAETLASDRQCASFNAIAINRGWSCRCDASLAFTRNELAAVAKLWSEKAGKNPIPARADFDARSLVSVLPHVTILERMANGRYRLRLHGTSQTKYTGDHTGRFIEDMVPPNIVDAYNALYDLVLNEGRPVRAVWNYQAPEIAYLTGESFVAPLTGKDGAANLLLSVTYTKAKTAAAAV
jgi:hypothetical protein